MSHTQKLSYLAARLYVCLELPKDLTNFATILRYCLHVCVCNNTLKEKSSQLVTGDTSVGMRGVHVQVVGSNTRISGRFMYCDSALQYFMGFSCHMYYIQCAVYVYIQCMYTRTCTLYVQCACMHIMYYTYLLRTCTYTHTWYYAVALRDTKQIYILVSEFTFLLSKLSWFVFRHMISPILQEADHTHYLSIAL